MQNTKNDWLKKIEVFFHDMNMVLDNKTGWPQKLRSRLSEIQKLYCKNQVDKRNKGRKTTLIQGAQTDR